MRVLMRVRGKGMALTDAKIRNAKPRAHRYRLADTHGLCIEIAPSGQRYWRYRYRIAGKENLFAAGEWCVAPIGETREQAADRQQGGRLTLAEARHARVTWRGQVKSGQHPRLVRAARQLIASQSAASTFKAVPQNLSSGVAAGRFTPPAFCPVPGTTPTRLGDLPIGLGAWACAGRAEG